MTIKKSYRSIPATILICLFLLACGSRYVPEKIPPKAIAGVLDLRDWDFEKEGPIDLAGEYEFYWQQHLKPERFTRKKSPEKSGFINVHSYWNGYEIDGKKISGAGYATYRMTVLLNDSLSQLAFKFLDMGTAYTVFANSEKILSVGKAGMTPETTVPKYFPQVVDFVPKSNRIELVYHVSNFHHRRGGAWEVIRLGAKEHIYKAREGRLTFDMILFGSILMIGLYHLAFFALWRKDSSAIYFGIFCIFIAVRLLTTVERHFLYFFPAMNWEFFVKIEYLSYYLFLPVFALFLYSLFSKDIHKPIVPIALAVGFIFSGIVLITPVKIFSFTLIVYEIFTMLCVAYGIYLLFLCALRKREGAVVFLIGFMFLSAAVANDILDANGIVQTGHFVQLGLFIFIFSQAFLLSFRFSESFKTVDKQREVLAKTNIKYKNEIAGRKQAQKKLSISEEALRKSEAKNRALLNLIPDGMFRISIEGVWLEFIAAEEFELFMPPSGFIGKNISEVLPTELACQTMHYVKQALQTGEIQIYEYELVLHNKMREYEARIVVSGSNEVLAIVRDITERKRLQKELARALRLEAAGRLAGQIAHDFNNLLGPLTAYPTIMREELPKDHPVLEMVDELEFSATQIAEINQQLLTLGRRGHYSTEPIDLNALVHKVVLSQKLPNQFIVREEFASNLLLINGGAAQLTRVLVNLITNGSEAIQGDGVLTLRTENVYLEKPLNGYKTIKGGEYVKLQISDTGTGIEPEIIDKIFDPFFTTKKTVKERGTGLGLSVVHSVMEDHHGYVTVESVLEQGTTFSLYFPVTREKEIEEVIEKTEGGDEMILIIDDDPIQRKVATQLLERLGYKVDAIASGEQAVAYVRDHPQDLLLLDMVMDGIDGTETYRQILEFRPGQKAIILSGYAMSKRVEEALHLGAGSFVTKPITLKALTVAVRKELERNKTGVSVQTLDRLVKE